MATDFLVNFSFFFLVKKQFYGKHFELQFLYENENECLPTGWLEIIYTILNIA